MIAKHSKSTRKTRTKLRKPKYLSLRLQLAATTPPPTDHHDASQLINLFPLHPENLVEEHDDMACIFSSCEDVDGSATTLTGLLCSEEDDDEHNTNNVPSPSSVNYADEELVRTAMRKHKTDRNHDHEKWVSYSEVFDSRKKIITEISSSSSTSTCHNNINNRKLVLKLDYENIIKSWVNKGPLYIHNNSDPQPQSVPDLQDDDFFLPSSINVTTRDEQDNGGNGGLWAVPQMSHIENNGVSGGDDALQAGESSPMAHNREASVQRYKEKRRNRLFAKTVRYEVRKLNAEKRPRIKGRFVKSN
ncbi:uncharacterized protein LOC143530212 isoform X2 [Bidens hawaiensis]|uniref:uncharacterized protein LOC143530212 isoform X2 n=1 Tax=Bidens hawaiensis TaxID=980011 RepID=UPI00404A9FF8